MRQVGTPTCPNWSVAWEAPPSPGILRNILRPELLALSQTPSKQTPTSFLGWGGPCLVAFFQHVSIPIHIFFPFPFSFPFPFHFPFPFPFPLSASYWRLAVGHTCTYGSGSGSAWTYIECHPSIHPSIHVTYLINIWSLDLRYSSDLKIMISNTHKYLFSYPDHLCQVYFRGW